jgi:spore coat protein U-like protein
MATAMLSMMVTAQSARAATDTAQLSVTATVESGCALTGGSLDFGTYVSGQTSDLDVNGTIGYSNCGPGTLTFELDDGLQFSGSSRQMSSTSDDLQYEIYRDANRSARWGAGSDAQQVQLFSTSNSQITVYGRIPANQAAAAGSYSDTVTITLTF